MDEREERLTEGIRVNLNASYVCEEGVLKVPDWKQLCAEVEAPAKNEVQEVELAGQTYCLANIGGELHVLDNWCPHRQGPLGQGWIEGDTVVCPWHAWAFDCRTGIVAEPEQGKVKVFPVQIQNGTVEVDLS